MPILTDKEFGRVVVVRRKQAQRLSARIAPDGRLRITAPHRSSLLAVRAMLHGSRPQLRRLVQDYRAQHAYTTSRDIGHRHHLIIKRSGQTVHIEQAGHHILASVPPTVDIVAPDVQDQLRQAVVAAVRREARAYLPHRLQQLAEQHGFTYQRSRLTHAASRWGSCSSLGTISLNIALMTMPLELIDYVIIHELCHTRQLNHSARFWAEVAAIDPAYQHHRAQLATHSPIL